MDIEELNNLHKEERRLWNIHQQRVDEANVARDTWYKVYREWMNAEEEASINKLVEERMQKVFEGVTFQDFEDNQVDEIY